jgi:hypothetical protein
MLVKNFVKLLPFEGTESYCFYCLPVEYLTGLPGVPFDDEYDIACFKKSDLDAVDDDPFANEYFVDWSPYDSKVKFEDMFWRAESETGS